MLSDSLEDMSHVDPDLEPVRRERPPGTIRIGQIAGIDVLITSSWFIVAALIAVAVAPAVDRVEPGLGGWKYLAGAAFAVVLYLSVLLHEAAHALAALHYGHPVASITLHFLGGVTAIEGESRRPREEFWVAVVGPLASIAIGRGCLRVELRHPGWPDRHDGRGSDGRQPGDRHPQPGARAAPRRRSCAQVGSLGDRWQPAPRDDGRRLGWTRRRSAGAVLALPQRADLRQRAAGLRLRAGLRGVAVPLDRSQRRDVVGQPASPPAQPGRPQPRPSYPHRARDAAAGRGRTTGPGSRGGQHRHGDQRRAARPGSSTRRPSSRLPRTGDPGSRPRRSPAPWSPACRCPSGSSARI